MRRIVLVHVRHVVHRDASGLTATACTGHDRFGARRTRNKAADAAESVDAHLRDHVRVVGERVGRGSAHVDASRTAKVPQSINYRDREGSKWRTHSEWCVEDRSEAALWRDCGLR